MRNAQQLVNRRVVISSAHNGIRRSGPETIGPVGYGVGICPPPILERFGEACDEPAVRTHIARQFTQPQNRQYPYVEVVQETIGPVDSQHVGILHTNRWRVERP